MPSVAEVHNEPAILAYLFLTGAADWTFTTGHPHRCRRQRERRLSWELHFTGPGLFFEVSRLCASAPMSGCGRTGAREPSTVRPCSAMASRSAPHSTVMWQNDVSSASVLGRRSYPPVREAQRALPASRQALTCESPPRRARRTRLRGGTPPSRLTVEPRGQTGRSPTTRHHQSGRTYAPHRRPSTSGSWSAANLGLLAPRRQPRPWSGRPRRRARAATAIAAGRPSQSTPARPSL